MNTIEQSNQEKDQTLFQKAYFSEIVRFYRFVIPEKKRILELGCSTGRLLAELHPSYGFGIDINPGSIATALVQHRDQPQLHFEIGDVESYEWNQLVPFDYIILSDLTPLLSDIQETLTRLKPVVHPGTRLILNFHNNVWYPLLGLASMLGLRQRHDRVNWLSTQDLQNLLYLSGYECITQSTRCLIPIELPIVSSVVNRFAAKLPFLKHFCLMCTMIARQKPNVNIQRESSKVVSVVVPTLNEEGNIRGAFERTPIMGAGVELIFIDGGSTDGTIEAINRYSTEYTTKFKKIVIERQTGKGKGQAVRQGFNAASGDILMILDSDLTMAPEDLPKYYEAIISGLGELINGSRLVYPMEKKAMRFLNMIANKTFAVLFTWLLDQPIKDTLCGTKVLWRNDYQDISANRSHFGDFDPFGDFDLLFGAAKLNLKIIDIPIRYRDRTYGDIKIHRWKHGWLLLKMCAVAFKKIKLS